MTHIEQMERLEYVKARLAQVQADWDRVTKGQKGGLPDLAFARDNIEYMIAGLQETRPC